MLSESHNALPARKSNVLLEIVIFLYSAIIYCVMLLGEVVLDSKNYAQMFLSKHLNTENPSDSNPISPFMPTSTPPPASVASIEVNIPKIAVAPSSVAVCPPATTSSSSSLPNGAASESSRPSSATSESSFEPIAQTAKLNLSGEFERPIITSSNGSSNGSISSMNGNGSDYLTQRRFSSASAGSGIEPITAATPTEEQRAVFFSVENVSANDSESAISSLHSPHLEDSHLDSQQGGHELVTDSSVDSLDKDHDDDKSDESRTLVLKNLPFTIKPEEVHKILNACPAKAKRVVFLRNTNGRFTGTVLAKYHTLDEASANLAVLNPPGGLVVEGRPVGVVFKAPKKRTKRASKEKAQEEEKIANLLGSNLLDTIGRSTLPAPPPPPSPQMGQLHMNLHPQSSDVRMMPGFISVAQQPLPVGTYPNSTLKTARSMSNPDIIPIRQPRGPPSAVPQQQQQRRMSSVSPHPPQPHSFGFSHEYQQTRRHSMAGYHQQMAALGPSMQHYYGLQ